MDRSDIDLLIDVATRFHKHGQTQSRIARELGLDPSTISRYLKRARDEGIVRIDIRRPSRLHADLGRELADRFGLARAVVVADEDGSGEAVARAAADFLHSHFTNGARLGLSFGRMPSAVIHALPTGTVSGLDISLLLGGFNVAMAGIQSYELARHVASLYPHSRVHYLQAPLLVDSPAIRDALLSDSSTKAALRAAASCELALVGIGNLGDDAPLVRYGHLSTEDRQRLLRFGAVGDVCGRFFDAAGKPVDAIDNRLIAIEREQLAQIPTVVAVAIGPSKHAAIRGALGTGYVNVLITDEGTAGELVYRDSRGQRDQHVRDAITAYAETGTNGVALSAETRDGASSVETRDGAPSAVASADHAPVGSQAGIAGRKRSAVRPGT